MPKFVIKDSPVITAVQKASRSRRKGRHANGAYWTLGAQIITFPLDVLGKVVDAANEKLEAYIAEQKMKETK